MTDAPRPVDAADEFDDDLPAEDEALRPLVVTDDADADPDAERVAQLIANTIDVPVLAEAINRQDAADAADTLETLREEDASDLLVAMDTSAAADALAEMEGPLAASVLEDLIEEDQATYASELLLLMAPDDAADLLQAVDDSYREPILAALPREEREALRVLLGYEEDSAGGLMTTEFLALRDEMTIATATEAIRGAELPEDLTHLPVVDDRNRLIGLVSLRDMLLAAGGRTIGDISDHDVRAVRFDLDQESLAREMQRYDAFMMPVVDTTDRLLGVVTIDDVIDIIREEQTEDVQRSVGAGAEEAVYSSVPEKWKGRFPWLVVSLITLVPATLIVLQAETLIDRVPVLAAFMPIVAALAGNAGHQALAVTLRGIVLDEVRQDRVVKLLRRELIVGLLNGIGLGAVIGLGVTVLSFFAESLSWKLGFVVGASMSFSLAMGTIAGTSIPLLMKRRGWDPAQSSAIFLIMITDFVGLAAFLGLASVMRDWLPGAV